MLRKILFVAAGLAAAIMAALFGSCASMAHLKQQVKLVDVDSESLKGPFIVGGTYKKTPYKGFAGVSVLSEEGNQIRGFGGRVLVESTQSLEIGDRIYLQLVVLRRGEGEPSSPNFYRAIPAPD